jgi:putative transposase
MFELFDKHEEFSIRHGSLPHWYQPGVTYFVTFRTDDSVPHELQVAWHRRREEWLRRHQIEPKNANWKALLHQTPEREHRFHSEFTQEFMRYLDRGYGACALRETRLARMVYDARLHFDGDRYSMGDFVVMPNHVHLLVCLHGASEIEEQCNSWKRFSARKINQSLGRRGRFWQEESFDQLVRSPEQFEWLRRYIAENPVRARLHQGEYLHWVRPPDQIA